MSSTNLAKHRTGQPAAGEPRSHRQIMVILVGVLAGMFLSALDQSIVGTALPRIVSEFNGLDKLSWVVTAYLLTSTASTPLWGKISDLYGRRPLFQASISVFLVGSVLAALSQNMGELIGFRAVQGLGAGGLMSLAMAIIGDVIPPRERGKYMGWFGAVFGTSSVAGPLLGGLLTDGPGWRWIFWINVPIGLAALAITSFALKLHHVRREAKIDYAGAAAVTGAVSALLLYLSWAGPDRGWSSAIGLGLLAIAAVLAVTFVLIERRASEPIIPMELFGIRIFSGNVAYSFLISFAMFGGLIYLPLYLQSVMGMSPSRSGLAMLPMVVGIFSASISSGRRMSVTGRYKMYPVAGAVVVGAAMLLLSTISLTTSYWLLAVYMFMLGAGLGLGMQIVTTAVQNAVPARLIGTASASVTFFRTMGGAVGTAVFGSVLTSRLGHHLTQLVPASSKGSVDTLSHAANNVTLIKALPEPAKGWVLRSLVDSMGDVFLVAVPFVAICLVLALITPEKRLAAKVGGDDDSVGETQDPDALVAQASPIS